MPNRIVSDITYKSKKVRQLPLELRADYVWIIPLFNEWGVVLWESESIWADAYALNRPDWKIEDVERLMDALIRVELIAVFSHKGHEYGYLVGSHKPGLLPKPSDRTNRAAIRPPAELLARYVGGDTAEEPPNDRPDAAPEGRAGMGMGLGNGYGDGSGSGMGNISMSSTVPVAVAAAEQQKTKTEITQTRPEPKQNQAQNQTKTISPVGPSPGTLVYLFRSLIKKNPAATATPAEWEKRWTPDFEELIKRYGPQDAEKITRRSQDESTKWPKYVFRGKTLLDYSGEIAQELGIEQFDGTYPKLDYSQIDESMI